jgi:phage baseplate assembly protein W
MAQPIGVKIPIQPGNAGYFEQTFTTLDEAKSNLINLLLTRKGERVMQPEFGTSIYSILFENVATDIKLILEEDIREAVRTWLSYILISSVDINTDRLDNENRIDISVTFSLKSDPKKYETINLLFEF